MQPVMIWSYSFTIEADIDDVYRYGFAPEYWFTFYPAYAGLEAVEGEWPEVGSAIRVRYRLMPGRTMTIRQEVIAHEWGSFVELDERALNDLWIDRPRFDWSPRNDGATDVTLTVRPNTAYRVARPLIWLVSQPFKRWTPKAMESFAASIEEPAGSPSPGDVS